MSDADVAAAVLAVDPNLSAPAAGPADVVLVTGPWLAGTTAVTTALRARLPHHAVVERDELAAGTAPLAVVFVVSATAPLTESDCALLDSAAADTDAVIGVVAKIDVHRTWREVLDADRVIAAAHAPRYAGIPWVGAAAAPDVGAAVVDDLVATVEQVLSGDSLRRRNRLRAWETRLTGLATAYEREAAGAGREARMAALRDQRSATMARTRLDRTERSIAVRSQLQQARVQLSHVARARCTSLRTELQEDAASATRRRIGAFTEEVRRRCGEVTEEVDDAVTRHLSGVSLDLGLPIECVAPPAPPADVAAAPLRSRRVETRLVTLLGAGFGLGAALTLSRLFADLAHRWTVVGVLAGAAVGVLLTLWMVGTRGLLHDRAVLDRWVAEVVTGLRGVLEERVATRVLAAESALSIAAAQRDAKEAVGLEQTVAAIDEEIRQHAAARARAAAERNLRMAPIARALAIVRSGLASTAATESMNRSF